MKKFFNPVFAASLSLFALTIAIVAYCLAESHFMAGRSCMYGVGTFNCYTARDNLYCLYPNYADCVSCGTEELAPSLPTNACIFAEGDRCLNTGNAGTACVGLKKLTAKCKRYLDDPKYPFQRSCKDYEDKGEVCENVNNFMPCY
jgi:hypothetical protein